MQGTESINLIKSKANKLDEVIKWALSIGRLLIILTELVAFSTFLYRFTLDRTLIDLHEKINQEQAIVASLKDREEIYRNLQGRITDISKITKSGSRNIKILNDVARLTPTEITFNSFAIEGNQIAIDSDVGSIPSLTNFLTLLRDYSETSSVSVDRIDNQSLNNAINVLTTVQLKETEQ